MRPSITIPVAVLSLGLLIALQIQQPTATVSGKVTGADGQLPEMIVYLECIDPNLHFPPPSQVAEISQKGAQFAPSLLVISAGQKVNFKNDEERPIEHNVFSRSPTKSFDLGLYKPPAGKIVMFDSPGVVRLFCSIHRTMDGIIYVCPTPYFSRVNPDGTFAIPNVPPGPWRLKTWQRNARYNDEEIPLNTSGAAVNVDVQMSRK